MNDCAKAKQNIIQLCLSMQNFEAGSVHKALHNFLAAECVMHMPYPLGDMLGADAFYNNCYAGLFKALPDLERRDWIIIAGESEHGDIWVGCGGHYVGTFVAPWLDIPPNGHFSHLRFHEFYRFQGNKVVEIQALWDIPELMLQANAWPMTPSLGREGLVPPPSTMDGITDEPADTKKSQASRKIVLDMLKHLSLHPRHGGPEVMQLERFWHQRMTWYGPAGIGTCRGIAGFRNWHQIPFLNAMPDRGHYDDELTLHFISEGNYVGYTGWPSMKQTLTNNGWLGIAPSEQLITIRCLDFWRIENEKIKENWVLIDLLDVYQQIGVDVLGRMREFNKARTLSTISFPMREI